MKKPIIAAVIPSYNMFERADALVEHMLEHERRNVDLIVVVVDNGSDLVPPSKYTTLRLPSNVQTTGGWLAGLEYVKRLRGPVFAYWVLITSAEFTGPPVLDGMVEAMQSDKDVVGVHPALTLDSTTSWGHLRTRGGEDRQVPMIDNIAALWRADWFDANGGFDPRLVYAWGPDLELSYLARQQKKKLIVSERSVGVKKVSDIGYMMQRMNMTADQRRSLAYRNMLEVMQEKYGPDWREKLYGFDHTV